MNAGTIAEESLTAEVEHLNSLVADYGDSPFDRSMRHWMWQSMAPWMRGESALEFGCLYGEFTSLLVEQFARVSVVDATQAFLDSTRQHIGPRAEFHLSLFETFDTAERFDNIFLMHVLEHLIDPVEVLRKGRSLLREGGRLFAMVPNGDALSRQIAVEMGVLTHREAFSEADRRGGHRRIYVMDTLKRDTRAAGLNIVHAGGVFLKALANYQFDALADGKVISREFMEACYRLGREYPTLCASIFVVAEAEC